MKRSKKIILSIICFLSMFLSTGCFNKTAVTPEEFKVTLEGEEYIVVKLVNDREDEINSYNYIKEAYAAKKSNYQIEFYEIVDEDYAKAFFDKNKRIFEQSKGISSIEMSNTLTNSEKYSLKTGGRYMVISRIENTVVYVNASDTYKKEIDEALKEINY